MNVRQFVYRILERLLPNTQVKRISQISADAVVPEVYNKEGEKMKMCYLLSSGCEHHPYGITDGRVPKRILWDRFNYKLDVQFFSAEQIFDKQRGGKKHYALLLEGKAIIPEVYEKVKANALYIETGMTGLFTHSRELLEKISNAHFCPAYSVWYGTPKWGGKLTDEQKKTKMISFVGCEKAMAKMHLFRREVTQHFLNSDKVDVLGKAVGKFASCDEIFSGYRYNIALENDSYDYYFTEKIMNCFAAKTVPIYYGCPSIANFFNADGIIIIKEPTIEAVEEAINKCSVADYESRMEAIDDNYERVKQYLCVEDYLCNHYLEILGA